MIHFLVIFGTIIFVIDIFMGIIFNFSIKIGAI